MHNTLTQAKGKLMIDVTQKDRDILRGLAEQIAEIAVLPVQQEKAKLWTDLNDLKPTRPLVWINEICWHELYCDELDCKCEGDWARGQELRMLMELYQWRHMPGDMVVSGHIESPLAISSTGFCVQQIDERTDSDVLSSVHFVPQMNDSKDIEKIKMPEVTHDEAATEANYQLLCDVYGGVMPVKKVGIKGSWFAPWDNLIRWWGVQEAMLDLAMKPDLVNEAMTRLVDCYLHELDQWEELNLLASNINNSRNGSGGYGYTTDLPPADCDPDHVLPKDVFGCATAQIFSEVSPEMHWEFSLRHEMRWLERWGLTYYGCCEPLDLKMGILRKVPNLRKVSMSPWIDPERAVAEVGTDYVFSHKPNPAILAEDNWRPEIARENLVEVIEKARGCRIEIILKDISTVRNDPKRLWEWETIAMEVAEEFAP